MVKRPDFSRFKSVLRFGSMAWIYTCWFDKADLGVVKVRGVGTLMDGPLRIADQFVDINKAAVALPLDDSIVLSLLSLSALQEAASDVRSLALSVIVRHRVSDSSTPSTSTITKTDITKSSASKTNSSVERRCKTTPTPPSFFQALLRNSTIMAEESMLLRIPPEIRMLIYDYLLDNGGTKDISIRNQSKYEYEARRSKTQRSAYHIMERTIAKKSYETTYCADPHPRRSMHTAVMHINRKIREEASHYLYTKHAFHFGEDLEALVPFLTDKTPRTRDLVREISLYKRSPTNVMEPDSYDWSSVCRSLRSLQSLDKLTLVIEGARPRGPWDGPQSLTVSDFRLLYTTRHESLEWARELASIKTIKEVVIVADIHNLPHPESNMMLVLAAFSSSIDTSLVDFLRDDLGIPARVGQPQYCGVGVFGRSRRCERNGCLTNLEN